MHLYTKDGEIFVPEKINPDLVKICNAVVKTCKLTFKLQMKTPAINNAIKGCKTEKMLEILPQVRLVTKEFNSLISSEIPKEDLDVFFSVISRMEEKAKNIAATGTDRVSVSEHTLSAFLQSPCLSPVACDAVRRGTISVVIADSIE